MKDRIKKIMELQHVTQQEFADMLSIAPATLSNIFTGRTRPTLAIVDAIKTRFPQVSTDWLMFGNGNMLVAGADSDENSASNANVEAQAMSNVEMAASVSQSSVGSVSMADDAFLMGSRPTVEPETMSYAPQQVAAVEVKKCDTTHQRRISEIRIFYDDQTWETFVPKDSRV